jgi:hypothetical protein
MAQGKSIHEAIPGNQKRARSRCSQKDKGASLAKAKRSKPKDV